jgi:hypothetical protein
LADAVLQQRNINSIPALSYFSSLELTLRQCAGGRDGEHFDLTKEPSPHFYWALQESMFSRCEGKVGEWFRQKVTPNPVPQQTTCWRCTDGMGMCNGAASMIKICLSIPVLLVIETGVHIEADGTTKEVISEWDFPLTLLPDTKAAAREDGVIYDIVGRAFTNGNHFIARYASPTTSRVFDYNSMQHGGFCQRIKKAKIPTHISGSNVPRPPAYHTNSVVYHLRGGAKAQDRFYHDRIGAVNRIHHISVHPLDISAIAHATFTKSGVTPMPHKDRYWLRNPYNTRFTEYVQSDTKMSPTKAKPTELEQLFNDDAKDGVIAIRTVSDGESIILPKRKKVQFCRRIESDSENAETTPDATADQGANKNIELSGLLSNDPFEFSCRCGARGDGNVLSNGEDCVQCEQCYNWSHIACQRGRVNEKAAFICDCCSGFKALLPSTVGARQVQNYVLLI